MSRIVSLFPTRETLSMDSAAVLLERPAQPDQPANLLPPPQLQLVSERVLPEPRPRRVRMAAQMQAQPPLPPLPDASVPSPATEPAKPLPPPTPRSRLDLAAFAGALGTLSAVSQLLAVRLILLLSGIGAFVLGLRVHDWLGLATFVAFCTLIVGPLIWLDHTTRRPTSPRNASHE